MFLRNFDNATMLSLGLNCNVRDIFNPVNILGTAYADGVLAVKQTNGSTTGYTMSGKKMSGSSTYVYINSLLGITINDICLGDGNTPVTYDDYKLSGNVVTNNLVSISSDIKYDTDTKTYITTTVATYNNSESEPITISEWGTFASQNAYVSSSKGVYSNNGNYVLLTREVLDEPVVIEPGTTATLTFTLRVGLMHQV